ncbi:RelA/SpoT family protein [Terriglobus aquaticus]|uniref:RelA/SpoT family protein n=1 Tax=Terriglobus aquaticus TaxID=940139 RepID=A0ABW9KQQ0_9BACT|nr:RelA/SpoT family protein [Terriglobus aquaticus]
MGVPRTAIPSANQVIGAIPTSDSGRNLEAALPAPAPMQPANSVRRPGVLAAPLAPALEDLTTAASTLPAEPADSLAEPSGLLDPLPPGSEAADPEPEHGATCAAQNPTSATYLAGFPAELTTKIDTDFQRLLDTLHANRPGDDLGVIRDAWQFCLQQHTGQKRASGEPYVIHPLEVGQILAEMKMDATAIAAGLLHDAVEDTPVTSAEIARRFGPQVAHIVEGVTKLDRIKFANKEDHQAENIRKMLLAMVTDIRVVIIKMADRLHNMRTLAHLRPEKQQKIARETLDIFAPLAHRLGMGKLRGEFEDLAFQYVDPNAYLRLAQEVEQIRNRGGEQLLETIAEQITAQLHRHGLPGRVEFRIKRLYSIQQKVQAHITHGGSPDIAQVHDLYAVRVITSTMQDCYAILGLLHSLWRPVPGRIKDFIAMPRPNLYQSLHTTLVAEGGHQFEVQIRTEEMHRIAEDGIAAHWKYKANESVSAKDEQRLAWVRQLMEWQREMTDPNEFMSTLKIDLYPEEVYTFTPKGKVIVLPKDASPIDFAYTIHTEVGHSTTGAKVNGRIVPLRHRLRNGDIVEITTQAGHTPSRDWLTFTKSSRARNKIKHWLNEHQRERAIEIGRKLLEREARKFGASLKKATEADYTRVATEYGLGGPNGVENDLLSAIGFGKLSSRQILNRLIPGSTTQPETATESSPLTQSSSTLNSGAATNTTGQPTNFDPAKAGLPGNQIGKLTDDARRIYFSKGTESLQVEGQNDLLIYRARCCNPIRGEEIIGYVTRGKGVAVHARTCSNVQNLLYESDRRINVEWSPTPEDLAAQAARDAEKNGTPLSSTAGTDPNPASAASGKPGKQGTGKNPVPSALSPAPSAQRATRYPVRIVVTCEDRSGMLKELTATISDDDTNIRSVDTQQNPDGTTANVEFVVETLDLRHLTRLTTNLRQVPGVREVHRVSKI